MKNVWLVIGGIGTLIGLYLIITNADNFEKLVKVAADAGTKGIATLQGRDVVGVTK